jgi:hypothetical protein
VPVEWDRMPSVDIVVQLRDLTCPVIIDGVTQVAFSSQGNAGIKAAFCCTDVILPRRKQLIGGVPFFD